MMASRAIALVAMLALVACGETAGDGPLAPALDAGAQKVGLGPSAGGGFVPGSGGGASATTLADGVTTTASGTHLAVNETREQRRVSGVCGAGNTIQSINADGSVNCLAAGAGTVTTVTSTGGDGITVSNNNTTPNLNTDLTILQGRVTGTAPAHKAVTGVNQDGTVTSSFFVDTAGSTDLTVSSNSIDVNEANVQHRVTGTCAAGTGMASVAQGGTTTCNTLFGTAGTDLSASGSTINVDETLAQHRVSTSCAAGSYYTAIAQAGTATCTAAVTAATCTNGQALTAVTGTGTHTCGDVIPNAYGDTHMEWIDEFTQNNCGATNTLLGNCGSWTQALAGTASSTTQVGGAGRPGVMQISTGTSATGRGTLETGQTFDFGTGNNQIEWAGGFPTLSDVGTPTDAYAFFVGFGDVDSTINQTNGCGFYYDSQNVITNGANSGKVQNLECYCAKASTRTVYLLNGSGNSDESFALGTVAVSALTLPNTNILHLLVKATGTTRVEFYTVSGTTQTKVCDINTNVPAASSLMFAQMKMVKNAGTTARTYDVDVARIAVDLTSARSP